MVRGCCASLFNLIFCKANYIFCVKRVLQSGLVKAENDQMFIIKKKKKEGGGLIPLLKALPTTILY